MRIRNEQHCNRRSGSQRCRSEIFHRRKSQQRMEITLSAVDRPYKKDGDKETDFIMCRVVGKTAEFAEKYITKGVKMIVRGRMQIDNYTDKDGNKRQSAYIFVEQQEFAETKMQVNRITVMYRQDNHLMEVCLPIRRDSCTFRMGLMKNYRLIRF